MPAVDEGVEQASGLRTQDILQDSGLQVVLELVTRRILAVFQQTRIAAAGRRRAGFLDVVIRRIGKAQDRLIEVLAEFLFLRQQL